MAGRAIGIKPHILIIDFHDSFTFNIACELYSFGAEPQVISFEKLQPQDLKNPQGFVLGPGPGHPQEYDAFLPILRELLGDARPVLGICLGHQLMAHAQGHEIRPRVQPSHGNSVQLTPDPFWFSYWGFSLQEKVYVQEYHSLAVCKKAPELVDSSIKFYTRGEEVLAMKNHNKISYQFHPESVGTTYPEAFFRRFLQDSHIITG